MSKILDGKGRILIDSYGYHENKLPYGIIKLNTSGLEEILCRTSYLESTYNDKDYFTKWTQSNSCPKSSLQVLLRLYPKIPKLATMKQGEASSEYIMTSPNETTIEKFLPSILPFFEELVEMFPYDSNVQLPGKDGYKGLITKLEEYEAETGDSPFKDRPWI